MISREEILAKKNCETGLFESEVWGGTLEYRKPTQKDKLRAKEIAKGYHKDGVLDNECLEAAVILVCSTSPSFETGDMAAIMELDGAEVKRYANTILGIAAANPPK